MKKLLAGILLIMMVFGVAACGKNVSEKNTEQTTVQNEQQSENEQKSTGKNTLVIYFSATGTTKGVAEKIAKAADADIYEIVPANLYSKEDLNWNDKNSRATTEMNDAAARPKIASSDISLDGYTTIYIGYPIWWGDAPRIMSTFVEAHNFDGKRVIPFCTSQGSGMGRSGSNLENQAKSGEWQNGARINSNISEEETKNWIEKNK